MQPPPATATQCFWRGCLMLPSHACKTQHRNKNVTTARPNSPKRAQHGTPVKGQAALLAWSGLPHAAARHQRLPPSIRGGRRKGLPALLCKPHFSVSHIYVCTQGPEGNKCQNHKFVCGAIPSLGPRTFSLLVNKVVRWTSGQVKPTGPAPSTWPLR